MVLRTLLVLAVLWALAPSAAAQLQVGADAPNFTLQDTQGVSYTLSDYADQVVVLYFVGYG